jgi:hypothetical protein
VRKFTKKKKVYYCENYPIRSLLTLNSSQEKKQTWDWPRCKISPNPRGAVLFEKLTLAQRIKKITRLMKLITMISRARH